MIKKLIRGSFIISIITGMFLYGNLLQTSEVKAQSSVCEDFLTTTRNKLNNLGNAAVAECTSNLPNGQINIEALARDCAERYRNQMENEYAVWLTTGAGSGSTCSTNPVFISQFNDIKSSVYNKFINLLGNFQNGEFGSEDPPVDDEGNPASEDWAIPEESLEGYAPVDPVPKVTEGVKWLYKLAFPIAVVIGVIKILINLIKLATSQGDPGKLQEVKEELSAILMGLLLIGGAASLINILGSALGI